MFLIQIVVWCTEKQHYKKMLPYAYISDNDLSLSAVCITPRKHTRFWTLKVKTHSPNITCWSSNSATSRVSLKSVEEHENQVNRDVTTQGADGIQAGAMMSNYRRFQN